MSHSPRSLPAPALSTVVGDRWPPGPARAAAVDVRVDVGGADAEDRVRPRGVPGAVACVATATVGLGDGLAY